MTAENDTAFDLTGGLAFTDNVVGILLRENRIHKLFIQQELEEHEDQAEYRCHQHDDVQCGGVKDAEKRQDKEDGVDHDNGSIARDPAHEGFRVKRERLLLDIVGNVLHVLCHEVLCLVFGLRTGLTGTNVPNHFVDSVIHIRGILVQLFVVVFYDLIWFHLPLSPSRE